MSNFRRQVLVHALQPLDLLLVTISFVIASLPMLASGNLRSLTEFLSLKVKLQNCVLFVLLLCLWHIVFSALGLYNSKRLASRKGEAVDLLKAVFTGTVLLGVFALVLRLRMVTPAFLATFWIVTSTTTLISRLMLRTCLRVIRARGHNSRNMLIVGSNFRAREFARRIESKPELGYRVMGFADETWRGTEEIATSDIPLVCDLIGLPSFLRENVVDELVIALPLRSCHHHASRIASMCEQQGIVLRFLSDLFNLKTAQAQSEEFEGAALITHYTTLAEGWPTWAKRAIDISFSSALLIGLAPLMAVAALLIKLTSRGPVLFVQKRVGLNKRIFNIYKFRTMVVGAERKLKQLEHLNEVSGPVFKIKNDPRVTPIGRILRKASIDELPQLFNVLKGDMSLVGPRPLQLRDYELLTQGGPDWQRCRFSVRPGITCLWQVNGRSAIPFDQWMELDLEYVRKWSLWLDFRILLKTIPAVLKGSGAA